MTEKPTQGATLNAPAILLQDKPLVYLAVLPGKWLLTHCTPSLRKEDPEKGFQRVVKESRAQEIAAAVLDQQRTFPNAIILASKAEYRTSATCELELPDDCSFLVVDGQHRLWAQRYSEFVGNYACVIHMSRTEAEMARLFLEINDTQRRVPSSLRWDLVRLVRPDDDQAGIQTSEAMFEIASRKESPFYQRLDMTGENKELSIKQGSLAPEIRRVFRHRLVQDWNFEDVVEVLVRYFVAIRSLDPDNWGDQNRSLYYKARVLRAFIQLLVEILTRTPDKSAHEFTSQFFHGLLSRIRPELLDTERIRTLQGAAGVRQIFEGIRDGVFGAAA